MKPRTHYSSGPIKGPEQKIETPYNEQYLFDKLIKLPASGRGNTYHLPYRQSWTVPLIRTIKGLAVEYGFTKEWNEGYLYLTVWHGTEHPDEGHKWHRLTEREGQSDESGLVIEWWSNSPDFFIDGEIEYPDDFDTRVNDVNEYLNEYLNEMISDLPPVTKDKALLLDRPDPGHWYTSMSNYVRASPNHLVKSKPKRTYVRFQLHRNEITSPCEQYPFAKSIKPKLKRYPRE